MLHSQEFHPVSLDAAVSLQCHSASGCEPASACAAQTCSFLCSRLRRHIQIIVSFSQVIQARHLVISDLRNYANMSRASYHQVNLVFIFYLVQTISDQAKSFRQNSFNLHVTNPRPPSAQHCSHQGILCFVTKSCIDLSLSQIATSSSSLLSALVRKTVPSRNPSAGNAKIIFPEIKFIMNHCPQVSRLYIPPGSDQGALLKKFEGGSIAILFFLKCNDFLPTDLWPVAKTHLNSRQVIIPKCSGTLACFIVLPCIVA